MGVVVFCGVNVGCGNSGISGCGLKRVGSGLGGINWEESKWPVSLCLWLSSREMWRALNA